METSNTYSPIYCWKCKAQNNAAAATVCRVCGAQLRTAEPYENPLSSGFSDHPAFKGYLLLVLGVVLLGAAVIYFLKPTPRTDTAGVTASKETVLPSNSWYNESWWSYVSSSPSLRQILKKNEEVNGQTPSIEIARTFAFSGKMSRAMGSCFEQACLDEQQRQLVQAQSRAPAGFKIPAHVIKQLSAEKKPETSDNYNNLGFSELGKLELLVKIPDRMVRKVTVINPYDETQRTVQISEIFNGVQGKRITNYFDALDNRVKSDVNIIEAQQIESARMEQASMLGKNFDGYTDMEFRGLEKVNDRVAFMVSANNRNGHPEKFFFDSVTGFLIKLETPFNALYFDDYRPFRQGMLPHTIYLRQPELGGFHSWMKIQIDEWKLGDPLEDSLFEIPV